MLAFSVKSCRDSLANLIVLYISFPVDKMHSSRYTFDGMTDRETDTATL